jgi:hypothetical protein
MAEKKKKMVKANEMDAFLDEMGIPKGAARDKAKTYCAAKISSGEGQCIPNDELNLMARSYYDGISQSLRGG